MFLKLLDGYLQSATSASSSSIDIPEVAYLVPHLNAAATFAAPNLKALLESGQDREPAASQDPILPRTLEASILLCQCLIAAALREIPVQHERELLAQSIAGPDQPAGNTLSSLRKAGQATVENLISKRVKTTGESEPNSYRRPHRCTWCTRGRIATAETAQTGDRIKSRP